MVLPRRLGESILERDANRLKSLAGGEGLPNPLITYDIRPEAPDTYDIGTSLYLYRKIWASEIEAIIFAQNVVSIIGGWLLVGHGEGAVNEAVDTTETEIDFGTNNLSADDFVLFRNDGNVEYMSVDSVVSGNVWNVTRNLDGSGANAWTFGTPYVNLGQLGDGRIELNSNDTPRISMIRQGATYNSQGELLRIGDLDGDWGYTSETWGLAIGRYGAGLANITSDAVTGIRIRNHTTTKIQLEADGDIFIGEDISSPSTTNIAIFTNAQTYNTESVSAGDVLIGDNSASHANIYWDKSAGKLKFRGGQTMQVEIGTDGSLLAGGGVVTLDSDGMTIAAGTASAYQIKWDESGTQCAGIFGDVDLSSNHVLGLRTGVPGSGKYGTIQLTADGASGTGYETSIDMVSGVSGNDGQISFNVETTFRLLLYTGYARFNNDVRIDDGLYVGANTDPAPGTITATDYIVALGGLHVGGTSDPGEDNLIVDGEVIVGATSYSSADPAVVVGRSATGSGNAHSFVDESSINKSGTIGYNSFDADPTIIGANAYDHISGFQYRPQYESSGAIDRLVGFQSLPNVASGAGTVTNLYHFAARDKTGTGSVTNQYGFYVSEVLDGATNNWAFRSVGAAVPSAFAGPFYVGDTANDDVTLGITINQGANDDEILSFKSSEVAHGMTDLVETDTWGSIKKCGGAYGGIFIRGFRDDLTAGAILAGIGVDDDTDKTTSASGYTELRGYKKSGASAGDAGADANLVVIRNNVTTRFIFDAEGSAHSDVEWTTFADHDDLALIKRLERTLVDGADSLKTEMAEFLESNRAMLEAQGIAYFDDTNPGRAMVNWTRLAMLFVGAFQQVSDRFERIDQRLLAMGS